MQELVYVIIVLIMSFSELNVNNEVIIDSSIQQVENVELGTFLCSKMVRSYLDNDKYYVFAKLNLIDEENKKLQIQIAFYEIFDESKYTLVKKFNTSLTKTSKKAEEYESSRQDNLSCISEGEYLENE